MPAPTQKLKLVPTDKILIALQFWKNDRAQAFKLAKLIADIQQGHSTEADFLFVSRFDCPHDSGVIRYVSRRFNTFFYTSRGRVTGWPGGCNCLWFGTMGYVYSMIKAGKIPHYRAIFTCESDGVPMTRDWISRLRSAWDAASARGFVCLAGAFLPDVNAPNGIGHINGNAMVSGNLDFLEWIKRTASSAPIRAGWDWVLAEDFRRRGWADLREIRSSWHRAPLSESEYNDTVGHGVVWHHGVKDDSLLDMARRKLL